MWRDLESVGEEVTDNSVAAAYKILTESGYGEMWRDLKKIGEEVTDKSVAAAYKILTGTVVYAYRYTD